MCESLDEGRLPYGRVWQDELKWCGREGKPTHTDICLILLRFFRVETVFFVLLGLHASFHSALPQSGLGAQGYCSVELVQSVGRSCGGRGGEENVSIVPLRA